MNRRTVSIALLIGLLGMLLSGCFEHEVKLQVARNGTGAIKETTYFSPQMLAMLAGMKGAFEQGMGEGAEPAPPDPNAPNPLLKQMMDREELEAKAAEYGEGVKLKDAQPVKLADGRQGVEVVYVFSDVSKVRIPLDPDQPGGDMDFPGPGMGMEEMPEEAKEPEDEKEYAKMMFTRGLGAAPARLTVLLPQDEEEGPTTAPAAPQVSPEERAMQMAGMQMMSGLRLRVLIVPQGQITKTNATFVDKKTNTVTLIDLNFDEMLKNKKLMEEMMAGGQTKSVTELREKMKAKDPEMTKALKFEPSEKVIIEFK